MSAASIKRRGARSHSVASSHATNRGYRDDEELVTEEDNSDDTEHAEPRDGESYRRNHSVDRHDEGGEGEEDGEEDEDASSGSPGSPPDISFDDELDADSPFTIPNQLFQPARILVNPRCVTTYAGVSHTQLAIDLFGPDSDEESKRGESEKRAKYVLDDWEGAPESFVCQEQRYTGGRKAPKTQRRLTFSIQQELERLQA